MNMRISFDSNTRTFSIAPDTIGGRTVDYSADYSWLFTDRFQNIEPNIIQMLTTWILGDADSQYDAVKRILKEYDKNIDAEAIESDIFDSCDDILLVNNPIPPNKIQFANAEFKSLNKRILDYYGNLRKQVINVNKLGSQYEIEGLTRSLTSLTSKKADAIVYSKGSDIVLVVIGRRQFISSFFNVNC